jgi:hypothetical protein
MKHFLGALVFASGVLLLLFCALLFIVQVVLNYDPPHGDYKFQMGAFAIFEGFFVVVSLLLIYFGVKIRRRAPARNTEIEDDKLKQKL